MPEFATAYVVKRTKDGRYLADRFYHLTWASSLSLARTFLAEDMAKAAAANQRGCEVQQIILAEYETE